MTFENFDCVALVTWIIFIFWEIFPMSQDSTEWYKKESRSLQMCRVPQQVFPIAWFLLKSMLVPSIFLFLKFSIDSEHWAFLTVYIVFVINILVAKTWTLLFFTLRKPRLALVVALILAATSLVVLIAMIVGRDNTGDLWALPLGLYIPYVLWLCFAVVLNINWIIKK